MPASFAIGGNHAPQSQSQSQSTTTSTSSSSEPTRLMTTTGPAPTKAPIDKQSWNYVMRSGVAGGLAGCAAKTVVGPLDRVKILFQASNPQFAKYTGSWFGVVKAMRDIRANEGSRGLFRGHSATLLRIFPYAGIKFLAYEQIRAVVIPSRDKETPMRRFLSGSMAGTISVFFTYPLEVIRVRLAFETKSHTRISLPDICKTIYNEQPPPVQSSGATATLNKVTPASGMINFFRGFTPTMWGMLPYAGCSFLTHDTAGDLMRHPSVAKYTTLPESQIAQSRDPNKPRQLKYWAELTTGGFAGFVSQTLSYPLEVIRRRMQVGGVVGDGHRLGMGEVAGRIYRQAGWKGFFVGLGVGYVKIIPMSATSFYVYERAKLALSI